MADEVSLQRPLPDYRLIVVLVCAVSIVCAWAAKKITPHPVVKLARAKLR